MTTKRRTIVKYRNGKTIIYVPRFDLHTYAGQAYQVSLENGMILLNRVEELPARNEREGNYARIIRTGRGGYTGIRIPKKWANKAGLQKNQKVFFLSSDADIVVTTTMEAMLLYEVSQFYGYTFRIQDGTVSLCRDNQYHGYPDYRSALAEWLPRMIQTNKDAQGDGVDGYPIWSKAEVNYIKLLAQQDSESTYAKAG